MLGAIIGDIVGSRWEFDPTNILKVFLVPMPTRLAQLWSV